MRGIRLAGLGAGLLLLGLACSGLSERADQLDDLGRLADMLDDPEAYGQEVEVGCVERRNRKDCHSLGLHYAYGTYGRTQDYDKAREYLSSACDGGVERACEDLGVLYKYGRGVDVDAARAMELFERSCADGSSNGCYYIGEYLESGRDGVTVDTPRAREYFGKACELGDSSACERAKGE